MIKHRVTTAFVVTAILTAASTASFAAGSAAIDTQSTDAVTVSVIADTARAVSATIPEQGGTVAVTGRDGTRYVLTIPDKGLEQATLVTLTPLLRLDGQPFSGGLTAGVDVEPDGLRLYQAATLAVTPGRRVTVKNPVSVSYHASGTGFHLYPLSPSRGLRFGLVHFSGYAISNGTATEVQTQLTRNAGGPEETLEQQLEPAAAALRTASTRTATTTYARQLARTLRDDFNNRIKPLLAVAQADCQAAKGAVQQALAWERRVSLFGLDAFFTTESQAVDAAVLSSAQRCWDEARRTCLDQNDPDQLVALLAAARFAALLGLDAVDPSRFDTADVPPCEWTATINVSVERTLKSDDGTITSSSSLNMDVAMNGQSVGDPDNGTYALELPGTNDLSTSSDTRQHDEQGDGCTVVTDISSTSSTTGSTPGTAQASLRYGPDGTYLLMFASLPGTSNGTMTHSYVVTDNCVPADSTNQTTTAEIQYSVATIGLDAQGAYDMRSDTITGSATEAIELPGSSAPATLTYSWTLSRGPQR